MRGTIQRKRDKQFRNNETYSSWRKSETAQEDVENQLKGKKKENKKSFSQKKILIVIVKVFAHK